MELIVKRNLLLLLSILVLAACVPGTPAAPDVNATATQDALNSIATQTAMAFVTATPLAPASPTTTMPPLPMPSDIATLQAQLPQGETEFLAYLKDGHLLVTDVTNGVQGGTTQYTVAGESDQVTDLVWSPSGEFVAFVSAATGTPHIFYIYALGQSSPTDLGPGSAPAWSPDSTSIAFIGGTLPNDNISVT